MTPLDKVAVAFTCLILGVLASRTAPALSVPYVLAGFGMAVWTVSTIIVVTSTTVRAEDRQGRRGEEW